MTELSAVSKTPPAPPPPPPPPAPKATEPPKTAAPKPGKPFSWKDDFKGLDKDRDGKLAKSELKLSAAERKAFDADGNGKVSYAEYRDEHTRRNSFEGLDANRDGSLDAQEMAKLRRFDDRSYAGADGKITKDSFLAARRLELRANKQALREARFKTLPEAVKERMTKRFAGTDGKLSVDEYVKGKHTLWQEWHAKRQTTLFARAGGKDGVLDVTAEKGKAYAAYDADQDGKVSTEEFGAGYRKDLKVAWDARLTSKTLADAGVKARTQYGDDSYAKDLGKPPTPAQVEGALGKGKTLDGLTLPATSGYATTFWNGHYAYKGKRDTMNMSIGAWGDKNKPTDYFCALPVALQGGGKEWHNKKILVTNPDNGKQVVVKIQDKGPHPSTGNSIDLSPVAMEALGVHFNNKIKTKFEFADPNAPVGPVS